MLLAAGALLAGPLAIVCPAGVSAATTPAAVSKQIPGPRYLDGDALLAVEQALLAAVDTRKVGAYRDQGAKNTNAGGMM